MWSLLKQTEGVTCSAPCPFTGSDVTATIKQLQELKLIVCDKIGDKNGIYLRDNIVAERTVARYLTELMSSGKALNPSPEAVGQALAEYEADSGLRRYIHRDVSLFDEIGYRNGCVYAIFGEAMAVYLRGCPSMPLPLPLLTASARLPHSYLLGRRCLLHRAINKGPGWQAIRVGSLLNACPSIPGPDPGQKWPPSVLERKVIAPFTTAMDALADTVGYRPRCQDIQLHHI